MLLLTLVALMVALMLVVLMLVALMVALMFCAVMFVLLLGVAMFVLTLIAKGLVGGGVEGSEGMNLSLQSNSLVTHPSQPTTPLFGRPRRWVKTES